MNRLDYSELLKEIENELLMPGGNFDALYGHDPKTLEQALVAADRLYSRLTRQEFELREKDEHR